MKGTDFPSGSPASLIGLVEALADRRYDSVERMAEGRWMSAGRLQEAVERIGLQVLAPSTLADYVARSKKGQRETNTVKVLLDVGSPLVESVPYAVLTVHYEWDVDLRFWDPGIRSIEPGRRQDWVTSDGVAEVASGVFEGPSPGVSRRPSVNQVHQASASDHYPDEQCVQLVSACVDALSQRDFATFAASVDMGDTTTGEVVAALDGYPFAVTPPPEARTHVVAHSHVIAEQDALSVDMPLFTASEGVSDLVLSLNVTRVAGSGWHAAFVDLRTP